MLASEEAGGGQRVLNGRRIARRLVSLLAAGAWLAALLVFGARVARVYEVTSDDATGVLEAEAVLRGNFLLRGWWLSGASFAATDLPFYVAGLALLGPDPSLLRDVPVVLYAVAVAVAGWLGRGSRRDGGRPALGVAAVLVLLGMPAGGLAEFVTKGYIRVGTTLGLLLALLALDVPPGRKISALRLGVFALVLMLTIFSDPYALFVAVPAILIVGLLAASGYCNYETTRAGPIAMATLGAAAGAKGLSWLISVLGGFQVVTMGLPEHVTVRGELKVMFGSARLLLNYLPDLYRVGLPAEPSVKFVGLWLGCLIGPALLIYALAFGRPIAFSFSRHHAEGRRKGVNVVSDILWFWTLLAIAAFLLYDGPKDRFTLRYMISPFISGAVLTGRVLADRAGDPKLSVLALICLALSYAVTVPDDLQKPPAADPAIGLARWLEARGLRHGYGPYWDASIVTASSRGQVRVRPVWVRGITPESHAIEPTKWLADAAWFTESPVTFAVFETGPLARYQYGIDARILTRSFGPATEHHVVGPYRVMVWNHDLSPMLGRESRP
jgi:hypothetical protein